MSLEWMYLGSVVAILGGLLVIEARWSAKTREMFTDLHKPLVDRQERTESDVRELKGKVSGHHDRLIVVEAHRR